MPLLNPHSMVSKNHWQGAIPKTCSKLKKLRLLAHPALSCPNSPPPCFPLTALSPPSHIPLPPPYSPSPQLPVQHVPARGGAHLLTSSSHSPLLSPPSPPLPSPPPPSPQLPLSRTRLHGEVTGALSGLTKLREL
ncbi:unnamed protein product [Closterium sp. NIES-53]